MIIQLATLLTAATFQSADTLPIITAWDTTPAVAIAPDDTLRKRRKAVEVSEWYGRRLTIHRALSYATIPVFGAEWIAGNQLYQESNAAPTWAKTTHRVGATALAGIFTVNTVTGVWNLWDSRSVPENRAIRTAHALMMLTADAAFSYAGGKLANDAEQSQQKRKLHRTIALSATGLTLGSSLMMKFFNK